MNMPGFTAEATLHGKFAYYRSTSSAFTVAMSGVVASLRPSQWDGGCNPFCVCVSPYNCPCCFGRGSDPDGWPGPVPPWIFA